MCTTSYYVHDRWLVNYKKGYFTKVCAVFIHAAVVKLPAHMRVGRVHSLEDAPLGHHGISLDNIRGNPSLVHSPKTTLTNGQPYPVYPTTASLDFSSMAGSCATESFNGVHTHGSRAFTYTMRNDGSTHFAESDHGISPDSGMGNGDYVTGTESGSSTLRSSHVEKRDRLSRLSEKSIEYLNCDDVVNAPGNTLSETELTTKRKVS